jgi:hypothetical protein
MAPKHKQKSHREDQQQGNPYDNPNNPVSGGRWRRGRKLMVRPNGYLFI